MFFTRFHHIKKQFFSRFHQQTEIQKKLSSKTGQVGLVLILAAAAGLIFYAMLFNYKDVSEIKIMTMTAATSAASEMVSAYMSQGEKIYREIMGGSLKKCGSTGLIINIIKAAVFFVLAIIATVLLIWCGACEAFSAIVWGIAISAALAVAFETVTIVLQVTVIQPGITSLWNEIVWANLTGADLYIEQGIGTALGSTITDHVELPDLYDLDTDGIFGDLTGADANTAPDYVSRFAVYNTERLKKIANNGKEDVKNFVDALRNLLYDDGDGWGLHDPVDCSTIKKGSHPCCPKNALTDATFPAQCDPCCVPLFFTDSSGDPILDWEGNPMRQRPECCDPGGDGYPCGNPSTCRARSLFSDQFPGGDPDFVDVYDPGYENSLNSFMSFREKMGTDDENGYFHANPDFPRSDVDPSQRQVYDSASGYGASPPIAVTPSFVIEDTGGFFKTPYYTPAGGDDTRSSIFPFFYKLRDWGTSLSSLTYGLNLGTEDDYQCHWCDPAGGTLCSVALPTEIGSPLTLPHPPGILLGADSVYSGGWCVDNVNTGGVNDPPQLLDKIPFPQTLFADENSCATLPPANGGAGGWKSGSDHYCAIDANGDGDPDHPYDEGCPKHGGSKRCTEPGTTPPEPVDCLCGEAGSGPASLWRDDYLDTVYYRLTEFTETMGALLEKDTDELARDFKTWYPFVADWIEPPCNPPCPDSPCNCPWSYTKGIEPGVLFTLRDELESFRDPLREWIVPSGGATYAGQTCNISPALDSVWCIPPDVGGSNEYGLPECPGVNPFEAATFDVNGNEVRGDLEDVVACLEYNAEGETKFSDGTIVSGNAEKFQACLNECGAEPDPSPLAFERCVFLPRSLFPRTGVFAGIIPFDYGDGPNSADYAACLGAANVEQCAAACNRPIFSTFQPPDMIQINRLLGSADVPGSAAFDCANNPPGTVLSNECDTDNSGGPDIDCASPTLENDLKSCACSWEQDCSGWGCQTDQTFKQNVSNNFPLQNSSCDDPNFIDYLNYSIIESENQAEKLKARYKFLAGRLDEAKHTLDVLTQGIDHITEFLDGGDLWNGDPTSPTMNSVSEKLINARLNLVPANSSVVIYVWQDKPMEDARVLADGSTTQEGYWHAVKVEMRVPERCNYRCGPDGGGDPLPPEVATSLRSSGRTRCFRFRADPGVVKAKVTRYDEDEDSSKLKFPFGVPFWKVTYHHPDTGPGSPGTIRAICGSQVLEDIKNRSNWVRHRWDNAFMLDHNPSFAPDRGGPERAYDDCWEAVHRDILSKGVSSVSCAEYSLETKNSAGFQARFFDCSDWFY